MINVTKSQPAPACLAAEKAKASGDYRCGEVVPRLAEDFHNKCYLCEQLAPTSINVEHFVPHQGEKELKFDWNNLFFACSHCNNTKLDNPATLLDVTNASHKVDTWIRYEIISFPKEKVLLTPEHGSPETSNSVTLLHKIYNGDHTAIKKIETANLRSDVLKEVQAFQRLITEYLNDEMPDFYREDRRKKIEDHMQPTSAFTAFKRWVIRSNPTLLEAFPIAANQIP